MYKNENNAFASNQMSEIKKNHKPVLNCHDTHPMTSEHPSGKLGVHHKGSTFKRSYSSTSPAKA